MNTTKRICVWSGPRNGSSAFLYAFAQREDTKVLDEPLYGHYLKRTGANHPGREEVLSKVNTRADSVISERILGDHNRPLLFIKDMPHHLVGLDLGFVNELENIFLIRNPREAIPSLLRYIPNPEMLDTAYKMQYELFERLRLQGKTPLVIDAKHIRMNPENQFRKICYKLGIDFAETMLKWQSGTLEQEGVWGKYWYDQVHNSTGIMPYEQKNAEIPLHLEALVEECYEYYLKLYEYTLLN
ncbi:MAG: sulfotransferase family protein [Bacteroidia bacterium]